MICMPFFKRLPVKLCLMYSIVLIFIAFSVSIPMYAYLKGELEKNIASNLEKTLLTDQQNFSQFESIFNNISMQVYLNSDSSGKVPMDYINNLSYADGTYDTLQADRAINNFVTLMPALYKKVYRINLIELSGKVYSNLPLDQTFKETLATDDWLQPVINGNGSTVIRYRAKDPWSLHANTPVFSFMRQLDPLNLKGGYLEVQFKQSDLIPLDSLNQNWGVAELSIIQKNSLLFTTSKDSVEPLIAKKNAYLDLAKSQPKEVTLHLIRISKNEYALQKTIENENILLFLTVPANKIFASVQIFRNVTLAATTALLLFSICIFYLIARIFTSPLVKLKRMIDLVDLENNNQNIGNTLNLDEIEMINRSFRKMNARLKTSMEETIRFRTQQLQSHFNILQAQINPHFLFNMLGVIHALAGERDLDQISHVSANIADFLRYSISTASPLASVEKEAEFANKYLTLMKSRYMERLNYEIHMHDQLKHLLIPKLTLQPLIENCIQHGLHTMKLPLHITILGDVIEDHWELLIRDNGAGFSQKSLDLYPAKLQSYLEGLEASSQALTFGGMGLVSTAARLKFMFKEQALTIDIGNNIHGGAFVSIKGSFNQTRGGLEHEDFVGG